jgi:hypothetical protein
MFNKTMIALSTRIVLSAVSSAFANNSSQYSSPDSTPNGPYFYADTYGADGSESGSPAASCVAQALT